MFYSNNCTVYIPTSSLGRLFFAILSLHLLYADFVMLAILHTILTGGKWYLIMIFDLYSSNN